MALLRHNAAFRRLWLARVISFLGDSLGLVALIIYVSEETGSGAAVGLLLLAGDFTPSLLSPLVGAIADRSDGRRTMVTCELGQAAAVTAIVAFTPTVPVVLLLFAVRSILASTFQAVSRSIVAELVDDDDLELANTTIGFGTHGLEAIGPLLAAATLLVFDPRHVLALDVATFLVSPLFLVGLPRATVAVESSSLRTDIRAGLGALRTSRKVWAVTVAFWGMATFTAADDVAVPFLATDELGGGEVAIAALYAAGGVGVLAGFALLSRERWRPPPYAIAIAGLVGSGLGNLLTGIAPVLVLALAMQAVRGVGNAWVGVGTDTLVQREVPAALRGRAFANLYGGVGIAAGVSYLAGGALVDAVGPRSVLSIGAALGLACAAIAPWASGSRATPTPPSPTAPSP